MILSMWRSLQGLPPAFLMSPPGSPGVRCNPRPSRLLEGAAPPPPRPVARVEGVRAAIELAARR
eukprot:5583262-Pyramimonas_sp.AAC.1